MTPTCSSFPVLRSQTPPLHAEYVHALLCMQMEIFTVDAFTDRLFTGNPAAVCLVRSQLAEEVNEVKMQAIAAEMNISETAFVREEGGSTFESGTKFGLRWFTPTCEVPLCGHATMATSAVLFNAVGNPNNQLEFVSQSGVLKATKNDAYITLDFPLNPCAPEDLAPQQELIKQVVGDLPVSEVEFSPTTGKLLVRLANEVGRDELESFKPNTAGMLQVQQKKVRGVIVTMAGKGAVHDPTSGLEYDFLSRYFAPWVGIPEDPVTGSAHTVLASYWSRQLGQVEMLARQCSSRGGFLRVTVGEGGRVFLAGKACIVLKGQLCL